MRKPWKLRRNYRGSRFCTVYTGNMSKHGGISRGDFVAIGLDAENADLIRSEPELFEACSIALKALHAAYEVTGGSHGNGMYVWQINHLEKVLGRARGPVNKDTNELHKGNLK